ncbi:MAG TPA: 2-hydroxyacid dehydrogenase [Flavobacteriales bacterium]
MAELLFLGDLRSLIEHPGLAGFPQHHVADQAALREQASALATCDVLVMGGANEVDADVLDLLPALELITVQGVGYDGVPLPYCKERGIAVTNTPDVLTDDVADLALALVLMTQRRLGEGDRFVRSGAWAEGAFPLLGNTLIDRMVGIVGLGRIGKALAARLEACGMRIAYHGRNPQEVPYAYHRDLLDLAKACDVLVLTLPGGPDTNGLVDMKVLEALGPSGTLINVARGSVVDETALIAALQQGRIASAGLDVFADEPHVPEALRTLDNVVLLPHLGSSTVQTRAAMADLVVRNIHAYAEGTALPTLVPELR